jgi:hypothetical protein
MSMFFYNIFILVVLLNNNDPFNEMTNYIKKQVTIILATIIYIFR